MKEEDFETQKAAVIEEKLQKDKNIGETSANLWTHIVSRQYDFDAKKKEVQIIRKLTKQDIVVYHNFQTLHVLHNVPCRITMDLSCHLNPPPEESCLSMWSVQVMRRRIQPWKMTPKLPLRTSKSSEKPLNSMQKPWTLCYELCLVNRLIQPLHREIVVYTAKLIIQTNIHAFTNTLVILLFVCFERELITTHLQVSDKCLLPKNHQPNR